MLVTLTHLSYLAYDKKDNFKTYRLMYGLSSQKKAELERYLESETQYYQNQKWVLKFLDVGKGLFSNNDSPGAVIASRCTLPPKQGIQRSCEVNIAFRGTRSLDDWGNNLNFLKTPLRFVDNKIDKPKYEKYYKAGQVHQGFLKAYNTISQGISDVLEELRKQSPNTKFLIRIGGHSLGGSLATLCAAHVAINFKMGQNVVHLETYGSPRTLGEKLSGELVVFLGADNIVRFVNKDEKGAQDMVTTIPFESALRAQFRHIGDECILTPQGMEIYEGFPKLKILRTPHRIEGYKTAYLKQRQCGSQEKNPQKKPSLIKKIFPSFSNKSKTATTP
jgi:hypothetical protein